MKNWLLTTALEKPKQVFWGLLLITILAIAFIPKIQIDTDPENMLPADQSERIYHNKTKQVFNLYDAVVVGVVNRAGVFTPEALDEIKKLSDSIKTIDGVVAHDLVSLSTVDNISQENNALKFEWLMQTAPTDPKDADVIFERIKRLPLYENSIASSDGKAALIYIPIYDKNESYRISEAIQSEIETLDLKEQYHITGLPVAEDTFGFEMFVQMGISAPLAALVIFVLMWFFFRNLKFVAAPMIIAMATVIITIGLLIGFGFKVHIMSSMIAIFLMPIAVVDSIHIMSEFADNYKRGDDVKEVSRKVVNSLYKPMLFTSVTSATGFLSLLITPIPPVQIFGAFIAFGILLAFILTIIFIPAYLSSLKPESLASLQTLGEKKGLLNKVLPKLEIFTSKRPMVIVVAVVAIVAASIIGITKVQINDNPVRWFKDDHRIRVADKVLNEHFAGIYDAYLVFEKDLEKQKEQLDAIKTELIKSNIIAAKELDKDVVSASNQLISQLEDKLFDVEGEQLGQIEKNLVSLEEIKQQAAYFQQPAVLKELETLQVALNKSELVGKANGLVDAVKTVNRELRSGLDKDFVIPKSQQGVAQALLQYQSSHRPQDLWHLVTKDYSKSMIWLQLKSGDNQDMQKVMDLVKQQLETQSLDENVSFHWAGKTYLNLVWQNEMVNGMFWSLLSAFAAVLIMMIVLFRSVVFGILAMLPLTVTIVSIYGIIGWIGKDYDMPIAVLSALTLGLSVDFAIHFLQRARVIYRETNNMKKTIELMYEEPANAISRNALVIAFGFTPLLVAPLMPYVTVGFFLASIMVVSALVTLLLLPILFKHFCK